MYFSGIAATIGLLFFFERITKSEPLGAAISMQPEEIQRTTFGAGYFRDTRG
jgi:hypothetical protein